MKNKAILYFLISSLSVLMAGDLEAASHGNKVAIFKLAVSSLVAGLTALKALQSTPDEPKETI